MSELDLELQTNEKKSYRLSLIKKRVGAETGATEALIIVNVVP